MLHSRGATRIFMEDPCVAVHRQMAATAGLEVAALPVDELGARTEDRHTSATDQIAFAELLNSGAYERHVRRMRIRYCRRRDRLLAMLAECAPEITPVGIAAGLRVLLALPPGAPAADELARRAAARSIELFPLSMFHHHGERPNPDGIVLGYGALPEHDLEAGLKALGDLLAESMCG